MFRKILLPAVIGMALAFSTYSFSTTTAVAQTGPCELDASGQLFCYSNNSPNMLEATCMSSANPQYCVPYHQRACQTGFSLACQMAALGQNCAGGDPNQCNYYIQILQANRSCNMEGNQQACAWMQQQGL
ncbi:hypothetical protein LJR030_004485 [Rhizobium sp. LjRoot30]|uniref:hypothetical protein n=1 Tax=Rhizobium sp. LjRoot30 TaxID=3342320 RepID=UPI003ED0FDBB